MNLYLLGGLVVVSVSLVIYALWPKDQEETNAIKRRMKGRSALDNISVLRKKAKESVAKRVMDKVAPLAVRPVMMNNAENMSKLRTKLASAGYRSDTAPTTFLASKTVVAVLIGLAAVAYVWAKSVTPFNAFGIVMLAAGIGFLMPDFWLSSAMSSRQEKIRHSLPDTLDLLVISVESGLGLDAALQRVGDEMRDVHPVLSEEMQMVTLESQMGIPRSEALTNLSTRTGVEEVRSLVSIVNQAERFGTSIARALRNQSNALRVKRRQAAEERAQKTTVKLMAPLILFIFPAILVVLAGPAALKLIETLKNTPGLL